MKKRAFIVHGWGGNPQEGWFPWLKSELEGKGFEVKAPELPETDAPRIYNWVPALAKSVKNPDEQTYFIGHSMGCQTIVRYLETLPEGIKVGGAVFVAGFLNNLTGLKEEEKETGEHWMNSKLDLAKVKNHLPKSVAIFSDNDPFVPLNNRAEYENILGSKIMIEKNMGHFSGSDGVKKLPAVLDAILELTELNKQN
ncbi:MAG: alpha/beta fold hydrolase [Patescibacteria group bacterium]